MSGVASLAYGLTTPEAVFTSLAAGGGAEIVVDERTSRIRGAESTTSVKFMLPEDEDEDDEDDDDDDEDGEDQSPPDRHGEGQTNEEMN